MLHETEHQVPIEHMLMQNPEALKKTARKWR